MKVPLSVHGFSVLRQMVKEADLIFKKMLKAFFIGVALLIIFTSIPFEIAAEVTVLSLIVWLLFYNDLEKRIRGMIIRFFLVERHLNRNHRRRISCREFLAKNNNNKRMLVDKIIDACDQRDAYLIQLL